MEWMADLRVTLKRNVYLMFNCSSYENLKVPLGVFDL